MQDDVAKALATLTTGVYVLTVRDGDRGHGMSSSWVTQVSGEPPLVMAAVDKRHRSHALMETSGAFALNVVGVGGREIEDYFFSERARQPDNLAPFECEIGSTGAPLLPQALASLECRAVQSHAAGDHTLFVAEIVGVRLRTEDRPLTSLDLPYVYVGTVVRRDRG